MTKKNKPLSPEHQRLVDFFWVYYDPKTSKDVTRHPEIAVSILKDAIRMGLPSRERLCAYAAALSDAVAIQARVLETNKKGAMS